MLVGILRTRGYAIPARKSHSSGALVGGAVATESAGAFVVLATDDDGGDVVVDGSVAPGGRAAPSLYPPISV